MVIPTEYLMKIVFVIWLGIGFFTENNHMFIYLVIWLGQGILNINWFKHKSKQMNTDIGKKQP